MKDPKNAVDKAIGIQTEEWNFIGSPRKHSTVHVLRLVGDVLRLVALRSSNDWHNNKSTQTKVMQIGIVKHLTKSPEED